MKAFKVLLCFSLFIFSFSFSYGQSWLWGRDGYGSTITNIDASPVATDKTGNAYITGDFGTTIIFGSDTLLSLSSDNPYLVKYNSAGNVVWATQAVITGMGQGWGSAIATDKSGNVFITGTFQGSMTFGTFHLSSKIFDVYVVKYDSNGNVLWANQSITPPNSLMSQGWGRSVAADKFGNVFVTGTFLDSISFGSDTLINSDIHEEYFFVVKYDSSGNVLWARKTSTNTIYGGGQGWGVTTDKLGNALITGNFNDTVYFGSNTLINPVDVSGVFLVKYSPSGNVLWAKQSTGNATSDGWGFAVITDQEDNPYITGYFEDTLSFGSYTLYSRKVYTAFLTKYDTNGNLLWAKQSSPAWNGYGLASDKYNHIYLSGSTYINTDSLKFGGLTLYTNPVAADVSYLMDFDTAGNAICGSVLNNLETNFCLASDLTGTYIYTAGTFKDTLLCAGDTLLPKGGGGNAFVGRWQNCGTQLGIDRVKTTKEDVTTFPNPFTNATTILLNDDGIHYLEVDDLTGRKLKYIEFTGTQYELSAQDLAKGLYFVRVYDNEKNVIGTTKIVVQ